MTFKKAENLLREDIHKMSLTRLQRYKVQVIDAWRESTAEHGIEQAIANGFYVAVADSSATGAIPKDLWLTTNLKNRHLEVVALEQKILNE